MNSYRGRFAPSPTGPLHFGSLFAALISYLDAKSHHGTWLVRIEDIDPLREQSDATQNILQTLEAHQLYWDEDLRFQSSQSELYECRLRELKENNLIFACPCSRKELIASKGKHRPECCTQALHTNSYATKFRHNNRNYMWIDTYQGEQASILEDDFVLKRKEGFYAYQLAVVCDDIQQGITHVIRGHDLIGSTPMQLALYEALDSKPPVFGHFPVICHQGQKLSKQNHAKAIDNKEALYNLRHALSLLELDQASAEKTVEKMLKTAIDSWQAETLNSITRLSPGFL